MGNKSSPHVPHGQLRFQCKRFQFLFRSLLVAGADAGRHHQLSRIEDAGNRIVASADKWPRFLDITAAELGEWIKQFVALNQQIAEKWQREQENQIIEADLDPAKVAAFEESAREQRRTMPCLRRLLEQHGKVEECATVPRATTWGPCKSLEPKEYFTTLCEDATHVEELGSLRGACLIRTEDEKIIGAWKSRGRKLHTRKDWKGLEPYFEGALACFEESGHKASLIVTPSELRYELFACMPKFVNQSQVSLEDNIPNLRGFYEDIPIIEWTCAPQSPSCLVVDLDKGIQIEVEKPAIEVGLLSEAESERILRENPSMTKRKLQLSVVTTVSERANLILPDKDAVLKLGLKLPQEAYWHPEDLFHSAS